MAHIQSVVSLWTVLRREQNATQPTQPLPMATGISPLGVHYIVISAVLTVLATLVVGLRFLAKYIQARQYSSQRFGWDDYTIVAGLVLLYGLMFCSITFAIVGDVGWSNQQLTDAQKKSFREVFFAHQIIYVNVSFVVKASIIIYYRRIFETRAFHLGSLVVAFLCLGWYIGCLLVTTFQCTPIRGAWDYSERRHCVPGKPFFLGQSATNLLLDVLILAMPFPMVLRLRLDRSRKWAILGIFLLGGFTCVASVMRIIYLSQVVVDDLSRTLILSAIWTMVEPSVGIISACLPLLRPLYSRAFGKMRSVTSSGVRTIRSGSVTMSRSLSTTFSRSDGSDGSTKTAAAGASGEKGSLRALLPRWMGGVGGGGGEEREWPSEPKEIAVDFNGPLGEFYTTNTRGSFVSYSTNSSSTDSARMSLESGGFSNVGIDDYHDYQRTYFYNIRTG